MAGYVKRINDATLRVPIGGVRIGSAKYSRLAQINLRTHIITFSRYAIENVPERGRRYLVIHELAHVKEANHNKNFWSLVGEHEPKYKEIGKELDLAFHNNVQADQKRQRRGEVIYQAKLFPSSRRDDWETFRDSLASFPGDASKSNAVEYGQTNTESYAAENPGLLYPLDSGVHSGEQDLFECGNDLFRDWDDGDSGIIHGGSDFPELFEDDYMDHF